MIKATQFRQKCCLLATPAQIAEAASRPAREKVAQEAWAHQTNDDRQSPISRSCAAPPKTQTPPGCSRESCAHQLPARPRLWHFRCITPTMTASHGFLGAIIPPEHANPGYAQPVYRPGCYWASQPVYVYDVAGRVVGYTGRPEQVCPGYVAPPPPGAAGLRRLLRPRQNDRVSRRIKSQRSSDKRPWDNALLHRARVASAPRLQ